MRINNNVSALNAWRNLSSTNTQMGKSLEKLSSGYRINRAADDASGLVISQSLRAQISGLKQATRNAQDGISLVQTAEGALNEVHTMLNRMRDLSVQSANTGTMDSTAVGAAQAEFDQLREEISRIASSTSFGNQKLLDGNFDPGQTLQSATATSGSAVGAGDLTALNGSTVTLTLGGQTLTHTFGAAPASAGAAATALDGAFTASGVTVTESGGSLTFTNATGENFILGGSGLSSLHVTSGSTTNGAQPGAAATFQVGAYAGDTINVTIGRLDATALGLGTLDLATDPSTAITAIDTAVSTVSELRGELGAVQNRFESTITNLQVTTENLTASESRIRDVDMAAEMTTFTKHQVLLQAGTAMLGQANSLSQSVLSLLQQ